MIFPPQFADVEDQFQLLAMRWGLREVLKLDAEKCDAELADDRLDGRLVRSAWKIFQERLAVIPNEPTARLFPFNAQTCSQRYTLAKKKLRLEHPELFDNLHMHDNRAEACTGYLNAGYSLIQVAKGISLHKDGGKTLAVTYARIKAKDLHNGPAGVHREERMAATKKTTKEKS